MIEAPKISIGLPVRNAEDVLPRCVESILSQDFTSLELVVSDNASDDETTEVVRRYARADRRIKIHVNEENLGLHANVNRVLQLSRGELFRWISSDDWLESECLSACVGALDAHPDAIGVTTDYTIHLADGSSASEQYDGEFPDSSDAARRFERMLWFFHAGDSKYDPLYGVYRRNVLASCRPQHGSEQTDWLLAAELALRGPIIHVRRRLAHRTREYPRAADRAAIRRRLDPVRNEELKSSAMRLHRDLQALLSAAVLTGEQLRRCKHALRRFWLKEVALRGHGRISTVGRRVLVR